MGTIPQLDLFGEDIPNDTIALSIASMALTPQDVFQVLTANPERMRGLFDSTNWRGFVAGQVRTLRSGMTMAEFDALTLEFIRSGEPFPNIWLGVRAVNQAEANERVPHLARTPAATRVLWTNLQEPIDLAEIPATDDGHGIDRVVVTDVPPAAWVRDLHAQCLKSGVAFTRRLGPVGKSTPVQDEAATIDLGVYRLAPEEATGE